MRVNDLELDIPPFDTVVRDFSKVLPDGVHGVPTEWEIEFSIDLLLDMKPISIPPYQMDLAMMQELKLQLKDLLARVS